MYTTAISKITLAGAIALLSASYSFAEERADVLERIAPIGKVTVESQSASAPVEEVAPAAVAVADPAPESAPAETEAVAEVAAPAADAGGDAISLATSSGCMGCHQIEAKVVGPAYKEVAAKYKDDAGALDMLVGKVVNGGSGTWGQIPMPPNAHVGEDKVRTIVEWVLTL